MKHVPLLRRHKELRKQRIKHMQESDEVASTADIFLKKYE